MKYNKEKLEQHIEELTNMTMYVSDEIVWEGQCGQSDHFDKLSKPGSNEKYIIVRYYDDCDNYEYVSSTLTIPADILFDDAKIDKWIKSKIDEALEKKEEKRKAAEQRQKEKERQEYERLKEKFGKYFI